MLSSVLPFTINDLCDIQGLKMLLENLGIKEDTPSKNKFLDYSKLEPNSVRIFNRIIIYLKDNNIQTVEDFIGKENIEQTTIVSKTKEYVIETVPTVKLRQIFRDKNIINNGEDIDENFIDFLEVSSDHGDTIMIKKLQKAIEQIRTSRYFSYFGISKRTRRLSSARSISKEKIPLMQSKTNSTLNVIQIFDDQGHSLSRKKSNVNFKNKIKLAVNSWVKNTVNLLSKDTIKKVALSSII